MRDIIWTLIIIWSIYQLSGFLKFGKRKNTSNFDASSDSKNKAETKNPRHYRDQEGEYVDFEELK